MKKYVCIGTKEIEAQWLPRWYGVSHDECIFCKYNELFEQDYPQQQWLIELTPLNKGGNYKQHLKILKTERLLNGI